MLSGVEAYFTIYDMRFSRRQLAKGLLRMTFSKYSYTNFEIFSINFCLTLYNLLFTNLVSMFNVLEISA